MDDSHQQLLSKIHRLEFLLAITFLFVLASCVAIGFYAMQLAHPNAQQTLVASAIELRDANGTALVRLSAGAQGGDLQLATPEGKTIVKLTAAAHGGDVTLSTREGGKLVHLGTGYGKAASLQLAGPDGKQSAYLGSDDTGGNLTINSKDGEVAVLLHDNMSNGGSVGLFKGGDHQLAFLGAGNKEGGGLLMWDKEGTQFAQMAPNGKGNGYLRLGQEKSGHLDLGVQDGDVPFATLYSPGGKGYLNCASPIEGGWWSVADKAGTMRAHAGVRTDGTAYIKVRGDDGKEAAVMSDCDFGGIFQTYARTGNVVFEAGCDPRGGGGQMNLCDANGPRVVWAGCADDDAGGLIRVRDLAGKLLLSAP